jgi:hypothetical protein
MEGNCWADRNWCTSMNGVSERRIIRSLNRIFRDINEVISQYFSGWPEEIQVILSQASGASVWTGTNHLSSMNPKRCPWTNVASSISYQPCRFQLATYVIWLRARFRFYSERVVDSIALRHGNVVDLEGHKVTECFVAHVLEPPEMHTRLSFPHIASQLSCLCSNWRQALVSFNTKFLCYLYCLGGLVVRVPGYTTEMYCDSCEVRTEFIYMLCRRK